MLADNTNHNRLAALATARLTAATIADRYIPAAGRTVTPSDNEFDADDQLERDAITADNAGPDDEGELTNPPLPDPDKYLKGAREAKVELNTWLTTTPVIQTLAQAKLGADYIGRTRIALKLLDEERVGKVKPLNDQVDEINATYNKETKNPLKLLFDQLCARVDTFRKAEETQRKAAADRIRLAAEEAARVAQEARARVTEVIDDAAQGAETDIGSMIDDAEAVLHVAAKLQRQANVAERDSNVRIPSVMGRAVSARTYRELIVSDIEAAVLAIRSMGLTEGLQDAICTEARKFKATWGELPEGVTENSERRI